MDSGSTKEKPFADGRHECNSDHEKLSASKYVSVWNIPQYLNYCQGIEIKKWLKICIFYGLFTTTTTILCRCFETAFMNENPVTRIVPQKRSETLMLQRLAGNWKPNLIKTITMILILFCSKELERFFQCCHSITFRSASSAVLHADIVRWFNQEFNVGHKKHRHSG